MAPRRTTISNSRSRGSRYGDYDQHGEEEECEDDDMDFTAVTVDDTLQYLDEWRDKDDGVVGFGHIPLMEGELLPAGALDQEPPDDKRLTEASGNEGATYERSYRRVALALWPANRMIDVLLEGGVVATLPYLKRLAAGGKIARPEAIAAAQRIVEAWTRRSDSYSFRNKSPGPSDRAKMIAALVELNAPALLEQFIREAVTSTYDGSENAALIASVRVLGDMRAAVVLSALVEVRMPHRPSECTELLLTLAEDPSPSLRQVAEAAVAGLDGIGMPESESLDSELDDIFESWEEPEDRRL